MTNTEKVKKILDNLNGRSGFDAWWDEIDRATKAEIIRALEDILNK